MELGRPVCLAKLPVQLSIRACRCLRRDVILVVGSYELIYSETDLFGTEA